MASADKSALDWFKDAIGWNSAPAAPTPGAPTAPTEHADATPPPATTQPTQPERAPASDSKPEDPVSETKKEEPKPIEKPAEYADFAPLGHSVRVDRDERKGTIAWRIKFRDGTEKNFLSPITTKPWGTAIPKLADVPAPSQELRDSQLLYNEPKYIRLDDGGLRTLADAGLKLEKGVYY